MTTIKSKILVFILGVIATFGLQAVYISFSGNSITLGLKTTTTQDSVTVKTVPSSADSAVHVVVPVKDSAK